MTKRWMYLWAAGGVVVPVVALIDLTLLGNVIFNRDWLILSLWPSSIMFLGTEGFNIEVIIALALSIGINMLLYAGVGFLIEKLIGFARRLRTST
jgi:hypothetical protein